jgi:hypothetical protein
VAVFGHWRRHGARLAVAAAGDARLLPRPGAWMLTFRRLMAFPMFATVAWLVWVLGQQSGIDGAGTLLALLVAMSMVVWALTLRAAHPHAAGDLVHRAAAVGLWALAKSHEKAAPRRSAGNRAPGQVEQLGAGPERVCRLRNLVRDLPVQQENHADQRRCWPTWRPKVTLLRAGWTRRDPCDRRAGQLGTTACRCMCFTKPVAPVVRQKSCPSMSGEWQAVVFQDEADHDPIPVTERVPYSSRIAAPLRWSACRPTAPRQFCVARYMHEPPATASPDPTPTPARCWAKAYAALRQAAQHRAIDLVNCFRNSEDIPPITMTPSP